MPAVSSKTPTECSQVLFYLLQVSHPLIVVVTSHKIEMCLFTDMRLVTHLIDLLDVVACQPLPVFAFCHANPKGGSRPSLA